MVIIYKYQLTSQVKNILSQITKQNNTIRETELTNSGSRK